MIARIFQVRRAQAWGIACLETDLPQISHCPESQMTVSNSRPITAELIASHGLKRTNTIAS